MRKNRILFLIFGCFVYMITISLILIKVGNFVKIKEVVIDSLIQNNHKFKFDIDFQLNQNYFNSTLNTSLLGDSCFTVKCNFPKKLKFKDTIINEFELDSTFIDHFGFLYTYNGFRFYNQNSSKDILIETNNFDYCETIIIRKSILKAIIFCRKSLNHHFIQNKQLITALLPLSYNEQNLVTSSLKLEDLKILYPFFNFNEINNCKNYEINTNKLNKEIVFPIFEEKNNIKQNVLDKYQNNFNFFKIIEIKNK